MEKGWTVFIFLVNTLREFFGNLIDSWLAFPETAQQSPHFPQIAMNGHSSSAAWGVPMVHPLPVVEQNRSDSMESPPW